MRREARQLFDLRLDALANDLRNARAAGMRVDAQAIAEALAILPEQQGKVMRLALDDLQRGRRKPNISAIARQLGISRRTTEELFAAGSVNLGAALTSR